MATAYGMSSSAGWLWFRSRMSAGSGPLWCSRITALRRSRIASDAVPLSSRAPVSSSAVSVSLIVVASARRLDSVLKIRPRCSW
jgi:hypothetical protein